MMLTHGLTDDKNLNFWEDDTHTHLIQESPIKNAIYIYYRNHLVIDCGTPEGLARAYGFTLVGKQIR